MKFTEKMAWSALSIFSLVIGVAYSAFKIFPRVTFHEGWSMFSLFAVSYLCWYNGKLSR